MNNYQNFLSKKVVTVKPSGFKAGFLNNSLFPFQQDIVRWALEKGKAAIFADCGLGKTLMQLSWGQKVYEHIASEKKQDAYILILAPLAVAMQTKEEGHKFGIEVTICRSEEELRPGLNITNYERLDRFSSFNFDGVILDESSILKSFMGKTKRQIVELFKNTPYRLACTATPAPNDYMELLNHAEFLGIMESSKALSIWFINDTDSMGKYRIKSHAIKPFWEWVSTWAVCLGAPSDIGHSDEGFILPELREYEHIVDVDVTSEDFTEGLFRKVETNATAFHAEKRRSAVDRAKNVAEIVNNNAEQYLVWCDTNYEADELKKLIPDAVEVRGSDKPEKKEQAAIDFASGETRVLISKPSIFGFGLNFQQCQNVVFCGLSYSYEDYYQAVRRVWRFGQKLPVNSHIVVGSTELQILDTIRRKEKQHLNMKQQMYGSIKQIQCDAIRGIQYKMDYSGRIEMKLPEWLKEVS